MISSFRMYGSRYPGDAAQPLVAAPRTLAWHQAGDRRQILNLGGLKNSNQSVQSPRAKLLNDTELRKCARNALDSILRC